jgi:CDGSH-type Zn-finger protein
MAEGGEVGGATGLHGKPQTRAELIVALSRASQTALEQASSYLYASYSLKAHPDEGGLTAPQARLVRDWKRRLEAAGAGQLASFAQAAGLRGVLDGERTVPPASVVVEPFSDQLVDRLADPGPAGDHLAGAAAELPSRVIDAAARELSVRVPRVDALAGWLRDTDGQPTDPAAGLAEIGGQYRAATGEAAQRGLPFDPVRPVAANPTVEDRSPPHTVIGDELTRRVAELFNGAWEATLLALARSGSIAGADADRADHDRDAAARTAGQLLSSVVRTLGEALSRLPVGGAHAPGVRAGATFADLRVGSGLTPPPSPEERLWRIALDATRLVIEPGLPSEVREAAAALQDLACSSVPADDSPRRAARVAELQRIQASRPAGIHAVANGPYLVTNVDNLVTALGEPIPTLPSMALCRCGQSQRKPFCDGTHARVEFTDLKDPNRVADHRDSYPGLQATIYDNRGICAHSGFCTDRLPTAFRLGVEPFVAPSGGRLDDLVTAVRACPSGALSYGIEGKEARDQVDQRRPARIEVSHDGPYRITGGILLTGADGDEVSRNAGGSGEHYSLCRCGQSQNKPFCSGMHWYVDFHDPPPAEDPTLFQWVGGLPALLRMTRIFYSKYVPEDPLLAPLFANMSPDHPERVAAWLSEVFGGPSFYSEQFGGYTRMVSEHIGKNITEAHRSHWVSLLCRAADDAHLPADPEFRGAFVAYLEWGSRIAVENSAVGARPPEGMPVPRWWWVCDATPSARVSAIAPQETEVEAPVVLPADGEPVSFERHVKSMFRDRDRRSMRFAFDLWSYDDVRERGAAILGRLRNGTMPCDGAWPEEKIQVFQRWFDSGMPA